TVLPDGSGGARGIGWSGPTAIGVVTSRLGAGTITDPLDGRLRIQTLSLPADLDVAGGQWSAPRDGTPQLSGPDGRSWFSPDGRSALILSRPAPSAVATWYMIDLASATASPVSGDVGLGPYAAAWSSDGRSAIVVEGAYRGTPELIVTDVA